MSVTFRPTTSIVRYRCDYCRARATLTVRRAGEIVGMVCDQHQDTASKRHANPEETK